MLVLNDKSVLYFEAERKSFSLSSDIDVPFFLNMIIALTLNLAGL